MKIIPEKMVDTKFDSYIFIIVFGLTWLGLEPMIYYTRGEHIYHYTRYAVVNFKHYDNELIQDKYGLLYFWITN
jgi:hypothetical protein